MSDQKEIIRERYRDSVPVKKEDLEIIPARKQIEKEKNNNPRRVCAYCRVSTDDESQTSSFELQKSVYLKMINERSDWVYAGLYYDEGISGTNIDHRTGFLKMIVDCREGKIDMIITKSVARFARNVLDSLAVMRELAALPNPVEIYFETEGLYSLDATTKMILVILSTFAEEESRVKSEIMNWSIDKRYERGIYLMPRLLGYDKDSSGRFLINPEEAKIVRLCYYLFLKGFSAELIAEILTELGCKNKQERDTWSEKSILSLLKNEKYCGDVRARKTFTPDFLTHRAKKNRGDKVQYYQRNHHEGIISPEIYQAALRLIELHKHTACGYRLPTLMAVAEGALKGFVPIDRNWNGFTIEDYEEAERSTLEENGNAYSHNGMCDFSDRKRAQKNDFPQDFALVDWQLFSTKKDMYMSLNGYEISFNQVCLEAMATEQIALYLKPSKKQLALVRPDENSRSFQWGRKDNGWKALPKSIRGFAEILFPYMGWKKEYRYRIKGSKYSRYGESILLFPLSDAEIILPGDGQGERDFSRQAAGSLGRSIINTDHPEFSQEKWIVGYRDCSDIVSVLSQEAMQKLEEEVKMTGWKINDGRKQD